MKNICKLPTLGDVTIVVDDFPGYFSGTSEPETVVFTIKHSDNLDTYGNHPMTFLFKLENMMIITGNLELFFPYPPVSSNMAC